MLTLTVLAGKGSTAAPLQFTLANPSGERRCRPFRVHQRTRSDVLHMLVGADSGRFPRLPVRHFNR